MKLDDIRVIDFRVNTEEPCCGPSDDGYDDFQAVMAKYFKTPSGVEGMLPLVQM